MKVVLSRTSIIMAVVVILALVIGFAVGFLYKDKWSNNSSNNSPLTGSNVVCNCPNEPVGATATGYGPGPCHCPTYK